MLLVLVNKAVTATRICHTHFSPLIKYFKEKNVTPFSFLDKDFAGDENLSFGDTRNVRSLNTPEHLSHYPRKQSGLQY